METVLKRGGEDDGQTKRNDTQAGSRYVNVSLKVHSFNSIRISALFREPNKWWGQLGNRPKLWNGWEVWRCLELFHVLHFESNRNENSLSTSKKSLVILLYSTVSLHTQPLN